MMIRIPGKEDIIKEDIIGGNLIELEIDIYDKQRLKKLKEDDKIEINVKYILYIL